MRKTFYLTIILAFSFFIFSLLSGCAAKKPIVKETEAVKKEAEEKAKKEAEEQARKAAEAKAEAERKAAAEKAEAERRAAEAAKKAEEERAAAAAKAPMDAMRSEVTKQIYFDFDKYNLKDEAREVLTAKAEVLKSKSSIKIQIEGHCDERGTTEYNMALGDRRAKSAKDFLVSYGMAAGKISTISYGKERPKDPSHNEEAWAKNRRDEFVIMSQ